MNRPLRKIKTIWNNEFWNKLIKNIATVLTGSAAASTLNFVALIVMVRMLGDENYAVFVLAQQYMTILDAIINFQAWQGVIKFGTEAISQNDNVRLVSILKGGFILDFFTAMIGTVVALFALQVMKIAFNWDEGRIALSFLFSLEIIFHIEGTSIGILRLFNKFKYLAVHTFINALLNLVVIALYYLFGGCNLYIATAIFILTDIVRHISLVFIAISVLKKNNMAVFRDGEIKKAGRDFFIFTVWTNLSSSLDVPVQYLDVFIMNMISLQMVSIYKVFKQMTKIISGLTRPISQSIMPQLSQLIAEEKKKDAYRKVLKIRNLIMVAVGTCLIISIAIGKSLMSYFFNSSYGDNILLFVFMLFTYGIGFSYVAIHPFFLSLGKAKEDAIVNLISNLLYIALAYIGVKFFGAFGIVLATMSQILITIISKSVIIRHELENEK